MGHKTVKHRTPTVCSRHRSIDRSKITSVWLIKIGETAVTVATISAVFPRESATSGWTSPVWMIFDTAWTSPREARWISCSDMISKGPLGPKWSLFRAKTAATSQLRFSAARLWQEFINAFTLLRKAECVCNGYRCLCDLCLCTWVSTRACRLRLEAGCRSPRWWSASHSSPNEPPPVWPVRSSEQSSAERLSVPEGRRASSKSWVNIVGMFC